MSVRTVTGRLASVPIVQAAGQVEITRLTVIEQTRQYRQSAWVTDENPTTHHVEAKFELGAAAAQLKPGQAIIVVGNERTTSWRKDGEGRQYRRVIAADHIAVDLGGSKAAAPAAERGAARPCATPGWEVTPIGSKVSATDAATGFTGFGGDITAELADARIQLTSAQTLQDYDAITYWMRAVVDLERADEGRR
ncbi:single-stranded DNA-binding protein [Mycetocola zhujimingii]|uniref:single-stranded DNA-binding protein n=1 Tax=Mycetocola zhujimingii TaxID=2079792 RepID=UPI000D3B7AEC|nr:single-stranded DNA-binding protein [Mycetocola zhujimingii]AWB88121.1 hypothetical protein C3E77_15200 [Mycetocola zhujimingii]